MHAVFRTPELVDLILRYFLVTPSIYPPEDEDDTDEVLQARRVLYRMALVNRAISHAAIPILWVTLEGALPLIKLVSGLEYDEDAEQFVLTRSLKQRDFERMEYFSAIVKHIVSYKGRRLLGSREIHPSAFLEICMARRDKPLVPGLQTLWIDDYCDYSILLLTNTLKYVKIFHVRATDEEVEHLPSPSVWNLLRLLPERAPFLEDLHVGSGPSSSNLSDILKLKHLKKLVLTIWEERHWFTIDVDDRYQFFKDLGRLPQLRKLNVGVMLEDFRSLIDPFMKPSAGCYKFPALESLKMIGADGHLLKLLTRLSATSLKKLDFDLETDGVWEGDPLDDYDGQGVQKFALDRALSSLGEPQFSSLTKIVIDAGSTLEAEHLRPLLRVSGMRHIDLPRCRDLGDELILEMASAWPSLEFYHILGVWRPQGPPPLQPTLLSIQTFARFCPNLQHLSTDVNPNATVVLPDQPLHRLERLTFFSVDTNVKITRSRVPVVAGFLSAIFPQSIRTFCGTKRFRGEGGDWNAVFDMFKSVKHKAVVAGVQR